MKTKTIRSSALTGLFSAALLLPAGLLTAQERDKPRTNEDRPRGEAELKRERKPEGDVKRDVPRGEGDRRPETDVRRDPPKSEGERRTEGRPSQPGEPERRLQHLMIAVENLRAAGMNELAENLGRQAEAMKRQFAEGRGPAEPGGVPAPRREGGATPAPGGERKPFIAPDAPRGERAQLGEKPRENPAPGTAPRGEAGRDEFKRAGVAPGVRPEGGFQPPAAEMQNLVRQMREEMMEMQQAMKELRRQLDEKKK